ncbi:MAG: hypothetical protein ACO1SV_05450 [Fimbriimonas sp.]
MSTRIQLTVLAFLVVLFTLVGCGGDGRNPIAEIPNNPYAGTYDGAVSLTDGRRGALDFTANAAGVASGTLEITSEDRAYDFKLGIFDISGTVDDDGSFTMSGNIPGSGPFTITGRLGLNGEPGTFTLTAGGETHSGTIGDDGNPGGGGGDGDLVFSNPQGTNADTTSWDPRFVEFLTSGGATTVDAGVVTGATTRRMMMSISTNVQVGQLVPISGSDQVYIGYFQGTPGAAKAWKATSGSLKVLKLTATEIEVQLIDAFFQPADSPLGAEGTFVIDGTLKK